MLAERWRYPPPLSYYDLRDGDVDMLTDPLLQYFAALDDNGALAGFACFGDDAQVVGGCYGEPALDIGFCLAPEHVGRGRGTGFVTAVCDFAAERYAPTTLRLSVASFHHRAIAVYRRLGFVDGSRFIGTTRSCAVPYLSMTRPASR